MKQQILSFYCSSVTFCLDENCKCVELLFYISEIYVETEHLRHGGKTYELSDLECSRRLGTCFLWAGALQDLQEPLNSPLSLRQLLRILQGTENNHRDTEQMETFSHVVKISPLIREQQSNRLKADPSHIG